MDPFSIAPIPEFRVHFVSINAEFIDISADNVSRLVG